MARKATIKVAGTVVDCLPNSVFCVELPNEHRVTAYVAAEAKTTGNPVLRGDKVMVEVSPYDLSTGRICRLPEVTTRS